MPVSCMLHFAIYYTTEIFCSKKDHHCRCIDGWWLNVCVQWMGGCVELCLHHSLLRLIELRKQSKIIAI